MFNGRQILADIRTEEHFETCKCAAHTIGIESPEWNETDEYEMDCLAWGGYVLHGEGQTSKEGYLRMVDAIAEANGHDSGAENGQDSEVHVQAQQGEASNRLQAYASGRVDRGKRSSAELGPANIVLLLCDNGASTESEASRLMVKSIEGIQLLCSKQHNEKLKYYTAVARILVFQEEISKRFSRAKLKFANEYPEDLTPEKLQETLITLKIILNNNNINLAEFAEKTYKHFIRESGKKNNLFFVGPPSTGKTMIMSSLVACHYNYCRLTGLVSNSSFNFSGLLHTNACLMDECKLTDNQFEQWKLLASGVPMSTDVKYKDRNDVEKCVLYTCSNFAIEQYCNVPCAKQAVSEGTHTFPLYQPCKSYFRLAPHAWEQFWSEYAGCETIGG